MIWYFNSKEAYDYPTRKPIENPADTFRKFDNHQSEKSGLFYYLSYMKENNIKNLTIIFSFNNLYVEYGNEEDINKTFCENNSIPYKFDARKGGCMVLFPGNVVVQDIRPYKGTALLQLFVRDFIEWLKQHNILDVQFISNDILVDGKKVVGLVLQQFPQLYEELAYFGVQITINSNLELISNICTKPMNKTPGALSDYGITTDEVVEWTLEWFDKHKNWEE